nr:hypothetical protein [Tanacetum cinerariifolium]
MVHRNGPAGSFGPVVPVSKITGPVGLGEVRLTRLLLRSCLDDFIKEISCETMVSKVIESIQRDQGHRIIVTSQQGDVMSKSISELERGKTRLRGMLDVASQRVSQLQHRELRIQREM